MKRAKAPQGQKTTGGRVRLLVLCYALGLLVWLCLCGFRLGMDSIALQNGTLRRRELTLADFTESSGVLEREENPGAFVSTDPDPRLVLADENGFYATRFTFTGRPLNKGGGEMVLYYTTAPGQGVSEGRKLWAQKGPGDTWIFDLHGKTVYALRFDPDDVGGVVWRNGGFVLNERIAPPAYFIPSVQAGALLLLLPLLGWGLVSELAAFAGPVLTRRRFEKQWDALGVEPGAKPPAKEPKG